MKIQTKSEKGMGKRGWGRKREGEDWQKVDGAPHLACALGPATWGSGPAHTQTHFSLKMDISFNTMSLSPKKGCV